MAEKAKFKYKSCGFRIHKDTWKKFKKAKLKSGLTWNLFIYNLIKKK